MSEIHSQTALHRPMSAPRCCPQQTPPVTEAGAVKWMRENLFSSIRQRDHDDPVAVM